MLLVDSCIYFARRNRTTSKYYDRSVDQSDNDGSDDDDDFVDDEDEDDGDDENGRDDPVYAKVEIHQSTFDLYIDNEDRDDPVYANYWLPVLCGGRRRRRRRR